MSQNQQDDQRIISRYRDLLSRYGSTHKAVDWGSVSSQNLRFHVFSEIGIEQNDTLLDVGCGLGDFYGWLLQNNLHVLYSGIDITPEMVDQATSRYPTARFFCGTMFDQLIFPDEQFDYVMASGLFYLRREMPREYFYHSISEMYAHATKGVAFNSLSSWSTTKEVDEYYADPSETLDFCRTFTSRVVLRHDYHPNDFTIYMNKENW